MSSYIIGGGILVSCMTEHLLYYDSIAC